MSSSIRSFTTYQSQLCLFATLLCASLGCSTLTVPGTLPFGKQSSADSADVAKYTVEMHPTGGKTRTVEMKLDKVTRLSEALAESGAFKKFRRMNAYISRRSPKTGQNIALTAKFDGKSRRDITIETDYAIHPDDRIIVKPRGIF